MSGHVFNDYNFGGYLIERHIPTFIDGRCVVFSFFDKIFDPSVYPAILGDASWMLVHPQRVPDPSAWQKVYSDEIAAVYTKVKNNP